MPVTKNRGRWNFRVPEQADSLVRHAAEATDQPLTEFVVRAAVVEAKHVLADRTTFVLDDEQWARFTEALDRPPQSKPGLEKLFSRPSIFSS
jgi:uncharacterized protein (DUF1778 family)